MSTPNFISCFPEIPKTETNFEERLILKAFLLKFMNAYAPIFYVAFFKGRYVVGFLQYDISPSLKLTLARVHFRFAGRPGRYVYVFNDYRMEEVSVNL